MSRCRQRVRLEDGLKLSLPKLKRDGLIVPGTRCAGTLRWRYSYTGKEFASVCYSASFTSATSGWLKLQSNRLNQTIQLVGRPRHFGGLQWYFECPKLSRDVSTLWLPPGAQGFASRQYWGRRVAYGSQFEASFDRACTGSRLLRQRLDPGGAYDVPGDMPPPKPKWMRWATYERLIDRIEIYDDAVNDHTIHLLGRLLHKG